MRLFPPPLYLEHARLADARGMDRTASLRLERGRIAGVDVAARPGDRRYDLRGAWVVPGLVNAHDHLELNTFPRLKFRAVYANARDWSADVSARLDSDPAIVAARAVPLADRLLIGGLKNLLAGTTTVAHHNPLHRPLRPFPAGRSYPVRVLARFGWAHSLYLAPDFATSYRRTPRAQPWMIHLAEGTDAPAQAELAQLDAAGALQSNTVMIHGVGLTASARSRALAQGAALVWCPSSNLFLLDATAEVGEFSAAGRLALGSDSRLTGERDLLDELRAAAGTRRLDTFALWRAVTCDAASILRLADTGWIGPGARADLLILPRGIESPSAAWGCVRRADLAAVLAEGQLRICDPEHAALMPGAVPARLDGRAKYIAPELAERYRRNCVTEPGLELA